MSPLATRFDFLKITLASPKILKQRGTHLHPNGLIVGQVTSSELVIPKTLQPVRKGLFCEKEIISSSFKRLPIVLIETVVGFLTILITTGWWKQEGTISIFNINKRPHTIYQT